MNDIWQFFLALGDGFRAALSDLNPLPILSVALLIGLFQPKADRYALKALAALAAVLAFRALLPVFSGGRAVWPDIRHVGPVAQMFLMYVLAYGMIGLLGSLKSGMKIGAAKSAH